MRGIATAATCREPRWRGGDGTVPLLALGSGSGAADGEFHAMRKGQAWRSKPSVAMVRSTMAVPDFQSLMLPVLRIAAAGETSLKACVDAIAQEFSLTPGDLAEMLPSQRSSRLYNRVAWAKTYLTHAGLLEQVRHRVFRATEDGRRLLQRPPERLDLRFLGRYPGVARLRGATEQGETPREAGSESRPLTLSLVSGPVQTPEEEIEASHNALLASLRAELLQRITRASPAFFEQVILDLLVKMGYGGDRADAARRVGGSGDGGIDGIIDQDPLGLDVVYLQAKRYDPEKAVAPAQVQAFIGALVGKGATKGVFVTTSRFSDAAKRVAQGAISQKIVLMDGEQLADLLVRHGIGVRPVRTVDIKRIDVDYFVEDESGETALGEA